MSSSTILVSNVCYYLVLVDVTSNKQLIYSYKVNTVFSLSNYSFFDTRGYVLPCCCNSCSDPYKSTGVHGCQVSKPYISILFDCRGVVVLLLVTHSVSVWAMFRDLSKFKMLCVITFGVSTESMVKEDVCCLQMISWRSCSSFITTEV